MTQPPERAFEANDAGVALADERRYAEAVPHYEEARALAPGWWAPHANLAIAYKHTGDFAAALEAGLRALDLDADKAGVGTRWNVGIAATAVGDWGMARRAWTSIGLVLPEGSGPPEMDLGLTPIRVHTRGRTEVVWCTRIDPARARIESIPTAESGRRWGDLVLHDGEPRGERMLRGRAVPVFEELALLSRSSHATWEVTVEAPTAEHLADLQRAVFEGSDAALEDWTESLVHLCAACSEGLPHEHEHDAPATWSVERRIAVATRDEGVFGIFEVWGRSATGRRVSAPRKLLGV